MSGAVDQELQALRRRAYGPDADIQRDPVALERLRELEAAAQPEREPVVEEIPEPAAEIERPDAPAARPRQRLRRAAVLGRLGLRRLARVRRSTVLIALGLAVAVSASVVVLTLVQRVQSDPLQVGAEQVARLSPDSSMEVPGVFAGPGREGSVQAFQEFHGLRALVSDGGVFGTGENDMCLTVFSAEALESATDNSFSGFARSGCEANAFPAMTQFSVAVQEAPAALGSAFPGDAALQFVYDGEHNEVVVFLSD